MTIKKKGILKYPIAWNWAQQECLICDYIILTTLFGGRLVDEAGKPVFNEGGAVEALKWMIKTIDAGLASWASLAFTENDVSRIFCTNDVAFTLSWIPDYVAMNAPELFAGACKIAPVPGSDILPEGVSVNGSDFVGISVNSKNKDFAMNFAKFWAGLEQESYADWLAPIELRLYNTPRMFREGIFNITDIIEYQYKHMISRPRIPKYAVLSKELQRAIHKALIKAKNPQEALNEAAERFASQL
jgi:multiple sugar transport system substrate-binding protein